MRRFREVALLLAAVWTCAAAAAAEDATLPPATAQLVAAVSALQHPAVALAKLNFTMPRIGINPKCWFDMVYTADKLSQLTEHPLLWPIRMVDSSAKIPNGILSGNFWDLGNFDECLKVNVENNLHRFQGKSCVVTLSLRGKSAENDPVEDTEELQLRNMERILKMEPHGDMGGMGAVMNLLSLKVMWCLPSTCNPTDVQYLAELVGKPLGLKGTTREQRCHTKKEVHLKGRDYFAIVFFSFFVGLAVMSTTYDIMTRGKESRRELFLAFSVLYNGEKLVAVSRKGDQIWCLHGIRFLSICWIILCHRYTSGALPLPMLNAFDLMDFFVNFWRLPITNGSLSVDSFFVMSGLLLSFLFLKEVNRSRRFDVLKFYVHRYLRITPVVAVMILLTVTLLQYGGWGPVWKETMEPLAEACEKNWWVTLLYLNNYVHVDSKCLAFTWYLSVDTQLYWLSPLVLIPLWKFRRAAKVWIALLLLASIAIPFAITYVDEILDAASLKYLDKKVASFDKVYSPAYTRFSPWLLGIILGAILYSERKTRRKLHPVAVLCGWIASLGLMVGCLCSAYPFLQTDYVYSRVEAAFFGSLYRFGFGLGLCWLIYACDRGYGGFINTFLSWGFFQPLSRLSYGLYMTHLIWITFSMAYVRTNMYFSDVTLIPMSFGDLLMGLAWTIPVVLLFEAPIIVLEKAVFGRTRKPVQRNEEVAVTETSSSPQENSPTKEVKP